ncbi:MAG: CoA pyrophosphatase [Desulfobacterales bacterium]|nr:CoA pyrophosphatase [Desulfobacterales bacterium]
MNSSTKYLLSHPDELKKHISHVLLTQHNPFPDHHPFHKTSHLFSVLLSLTVYDDQGKKQKEPYLILNKRSMQVKQPGDICLPGGRMMVKWDRILSYILRLPRFPFALFQNKVCLTKQTHLDASYLSRLLATALRESFEEMRLNPFNIDFLGNLPEQRLVLFTKSIWPMVIWINRQTSFSPNWEVERILYVPLAELLNQINYVRCRVRFVSKPTQCILTPSMDYHGFQLNTGDILWGATFRIVMSFLSIVFGFELPAIETLPVVSKWMDATYLTPQKKQG